MSSTPHLIEIELSVQNETSGELENASNSLQKLVQEKANFESPATAQNSPFSELNTDINNALVEMKQLTVQTQQTISELSKIKEQSGDSGLGNIGLEALGVAASFVELDNMVGKAGGRTPLLEGLTSSLLNLFGAGKKAPELTQGLASASRSFSRTAATAANFSETVLMASDGLLMLRQRTGAASSVATMGASFSSAGAGAGALSVGVLGVAAAAGFAGYQLARLVQAYSGYRNAERAAEQAAGELRIKRTEEAIQLSKINAALGTNYQSLQEANKALSENASLAKQAADAMGIQTNKVSSTNNALAEFEAKTEAARRVAGEFLNIKTENQIAGEIQNSIDAYGRFISKVGITEEEVERAFDALAEKLKSLDVDPEVMDKLLNDIKEKSPELTELIDELNASVGGLGGAYDALGIVPVDEIKKQAQEAIDHLETIRKKHGKNSSEYSQGLEAVNKEVEELKKIAPEAVSDLKNIPVGVDGKVYEDTKKKIGDLIVNGEKMILPGVDAASADKAQKAFDKLGKKETKVYEVVYKVKNKPNDPSSSADPEEYADGGSVFRRLSSPVIASGSGVKDDVPAMLMRGEFVMKQDAVRKYGLPLMYALNNMNVPLESLNIPRFAEGGEVGRERAFAIDLFRRFEEQTKFQELSKFNVQEDLDRTFGAFESIAKQVKLGMLTPSLGKSSLQEHYEQQVKLLTRQYDVQIQTARDLGFEDLAHIWKSQLEEVKNLIEQYKETLVSLLDEYSDAVDDAQEARRQAMEDAAAQEASASSSTSSRTSSTTPASSGGSTKTGRFRRYPNKDNPAKVIIDARRARENGGSSATRSSSTSSRIAAQLAAARARQAAEREYQRAMRIATREFRREARISGREMVRDARGISREAGHDYRRGKIELRGELQLLEVEYAKALAELRNEYTRVDISGFSNWLAAGGEVRPNRALERFHKLAPAFFQAAQHFHDGGRVKGAGQPGQDTVPAMLAPGEFVMTHNAVNLVGEQYLEHINRQARFNRMLSDDVRYMSKGGAVRAYDDLEPTLGVIRDSSGTPTRLARNTNTNSSTNDEITIRLDVNGREYPMRGKRNIARDLAKELKRMKRTMI